MSARAAARLAWALWTLSLTLTALSLLLLALNLSHPNTHIFDWWFNNTLVVIDVTVGAIVASRRPGNPVGWLLCLSGVAISLNNFSAQYAIYALLAQPNSLPAGEALAWIASWLLPIYGGLQLFYILLFPTGRLPSRSWRWLAWLTVAFMSMGVILSAFSSEAYFGSLGPIRNPLGIEGFTNLYEALLYTMAPFLYAAAALSVFMRLRRAVGVEHQQLKWFAYGAAIFATGIVFILIPLATETPAWFEWGGHAFFAAAGTLIPISIGIAILRYRLYDIDLLINRTLVYGALTLSVAGVYVFAVGYLGALFRTGDNFVVSLLATGLVAVLFAPLRDRLQRAVNRLMYGERDDPYAVVSRLGERLETTLAPNAVLSTIVQTIKESLKLPHAAITLMENHASKVATSVGEPVEKPLRLPLIYQGEPVGELLLSPRAPNETFGPADRRLLEGLARQAGVAAYAVRVTTDLQRSRERLVAAREEERRRLRRDLHDGLGAQLAGLYVQAGALRHLLRRDPDGADELMVELRDELRGTIADIRRLVYDLRPPALDDLGLVAALHQLAERYGSEGGQLRVRVEVPEDLPHLPAAVEVAVYRVTQEALTNVVRHAQAKTCVVQLAVDEDVALDVVDDGVGIPTEHAAGVGLYSMRERAAELGGSCIVESIPEGGTRVLVRLPLPKE